jgi:DNA-binding transcriptional LysR family regulator
MNKSTAKTSRSAPGDRLVLLATFRDIVEAGSLSAAAEREGTTQPTVSRRLRALEDELGVRLLHRTTHSVRMTADGERCYARARDLLREWERFEEDLRGDAAEPKGTLRVVVPHAFGQEKLVDPLAVFLKRYPRMRVEWMLHDAVPDFVTEGIDCAIHLGEVRDAGLVAKKLVDVVRHVFAAPSLFPDGRLPRSPRELEELPWVSLKGYYRDSIELVPARGGRNARLAFRSCLTTDNIYALRHAAMLGLGVCVGSSWLMADAVDRGELVRLLPGWHADSMPVHLVYPYARHLPARLRRFAELVGELVPKALDEATMPDFREG